MPSGVFSFNKSPLFQGSHTRTEIKTHGRRREQLHGQGSREAVLKSCRDSLVISAGQGQTREEVLEDFILCLSLDGRGCFSAELLTFQLTVNRPLCAPHYVCLGHGGSLAKNDMVPPFISPIHSLTVVV